MTSYMNRDDRHLHLLPKITPDRVDTLCGVPRETAPMSIRILARGWLVERARCRKLRENLRASQLEAAAERARRLDAHDELVDEQKEHGRIRVLAQLAAIKYKAETELRSEAIAKLRARVHDLRGQAHSEAIGTGILEALDALPAFEQPLVDGWTCNVCGQSVRGPNSHACMGVPGHD